MPAGFEGEMTTIKLGKMLNRGSVINSVFIDSIKTKQSAVIERTVHAGDTAFKPFDTSTVMDGI